MQNLAILPFLFLIGCATATAPRGLTLELVRLDRTAGRQTTAELVLRNQSPDPFEYRGYSPEQPYPLDRIEFRKGQAWRAATALASCDSGVSSFTLLPGESITMTYPIYLWRGATAYRVTISESRGTFVVRSKPFVLPKVR